MIMHEPFLKGYFVNNSFLYWGNLILMVGSVLLAGKIKKLLIKKRMPLKIDK